MNQTYLDTARLLTQVAPFVFADDTFALKGGTAINLFVRDMPRLSVDLDLVFRGRARLDLAWPTPPRTSAGNPLEAAKSRKTEEGRSWKVRAAV